MKHSPSPFLPLFLILLFALPAAPGFAQSDKRREFIEGLFRSIIESRSKPGMTPPGFAPPVQTPPVVNVPPPQNQVPQQVGQYRNLINNYSQQTNTLANNLGKDSIQNSSLRGYLPELYSIRSQALHLQQNCNNVTQLTTVEPTFRALDTSWRDLSFRLQADPSIDAGCRQNVARIDDYSRQLCDLFGIQADFDRNRAVFLAGQASAYLTALVDLLEEQLRHQRNASGLQQEGRQLVGMASQFGLNVSAYSLPQAVEACEGWGNAWLVYAAKLRTIQSQPLALAMSRVSQSQHELYDLMRVQRPIDYSHIQIITSQAQESIQTLFNQLSIGVVGRMPQNQIQALIASQNQVARQMQVLQSSIQGTPNHDQVTRNFVALNNAWARCDHNLVSLPNPIPSYRSSVQSQMSQLRDVLQVSDGLDMNLTLTRAAALEGLANNLYTSLAQRAQFIPSSRVRNEVFLVTQQFLQNCTIFHAQVANGSEPATLQTSCGNMIDSWQRCSQSIQALPARGVQPQIYQSLERIRSQIDLAIAELGVVITP